MTRRRLGCVAAMALFALTIRPAAQSVYPTGTTIYEQTLQRAASSTESAR